MFLVSSCSRLSPVDLSRVKSGMQMELELEQRRQTQRCAAYITGLTVPK